MDDIDLLTEHFTGKSRAFFLAHPEYRVPLAEQKKLDEAMERYRNGEPAAYIMGTASFYGHDFFVSPDCLIPRSDTELLVQKLIAALPKGGCFADLCTGSGCIAVSALKSVPDSSCLAVDLSSKALAIAKKNALIHAVSRRTVFLQADVLKPHFLLGYTFDCIVSNPPYIASRVVDTLDDYVKKEPRMALDGGEDGLRFYRFMIPQYIRFLNPNGIMLFEIGYDQGEAIKEISISCGLACTVYKDLNGNDRVAMIKRIG